MHIPAISPLYLHLLASIPSLLVSHLLHLPSFSLYSLCTYIYPDSAPSSTPRAVLRPANSKPSKRNPSSTPFDTSAAQLYRLRLDHSALSSRHRFPSFHLSLLLSFSLSLPSLLLHYFNSSSSLAFFPFLFVFISATFLVVTLVRLSVEKSASRRSEKFFSLFAFVASPIVALILIQFLSINPPPGIASAFTGLISALVFIPAARFSRGFWLGTDQLRFDLPVLSCSSIGLVLLYSTALVSLASPALFLKSFLPPFFVATAEAIQVPVLAVAAVLQILSLRAMVQMYVNEAVTCWYQQLHVTRISDLDYARAKMFLHNHHLCTVATQLFAPPALVLLLLGLSQLRGNLFEGVEFFQSFTDLSDIVKEMALFTAWWVMFAWSIVTMAILACYRFGLLLIS
ncbi:Transmembrane protein 161B [Rhynchospora pubera]|uniref:Transmembrane protein 161B n=1 Tax=Rhynchospora pubera TaxID=906938 RepID=A0AAV8E698_9POAL|nr:Transmembrane protein 161B [Rhynchospora pubera]